MGAAKGREWLERVRRRELLVFDGGYGTMLFAAGLADGACPELWNDTHPDVVRGIHQAYFEAGSDFVETNTFGGTRLKLGAYGIPERTRELNEKGARLARAVCPPTGYVAGSIGPTSHLVEPYGDVSAAELYENFKEQAEALAEGGVDLFAVETMMYPEEALAAIRACKDATGLPVMATMFFQYEELHDRDRTMWGESPAEVAGKLLAGGADAVGMNCGRGPDRAVVIIREMRAATAAPLVAYPNAGLPVTTWVARCRGCGYTHPEKTPPEGCPRCRGRDFEARDRVTYELGPTEMVRDYPALLDAGATIVGACCGSTPEHIRLIAEVVRARRR